jgi:hypothetical protein
LPVRAEKIDAEGQLTDAVTAESLQHYLGAFGKWVQRFTQVRCETDDLVAAAALAGSKLLGRTL